MIVGECGINHNGSLLRALHMISMAKDAGCDAIKFQTYHADEICEKGIPFTYGEVTEDMHDMFTRCQLGDREWYTLKAECDRLDIEFMSTPMGIDSLNLLLDVGIKRVKVASSDLTNIPLLEAISKTGLPVILSAGMADDESLRAAILAGNRSAGLTTAVCTSEYPTQPINVNISRMLHFMFGRGLSDHTIGNTAAIMAVAYGATYFEKHITLDNNMAGPDHAFSANPEQLKSWVNAIKEAQLMVGSGKIEPTEQELVNRKVWRKTAENGYIRR